MPFFKSFSTNIESGTMRAGKNPHSELPACSTKRYMNYHHNLSQQIKQINSIEPQGVTSKLNGRYSNNLRQ